jgi:hypothetical protein
MTMNSIFSRLNLAAILIFISVVSLSAQEFSAKLKFEEPIDVTALANEDFIKDKDEVILKDHRVNELNYSEKGELKAYFYIHKRVFVNSDDAVSRNNKIYVSFSNAIDLIDFDARVISPNNEIKTLGKEALKEGVDEDDVKYNYFAISGAEVGGVIEYYYLIERNPVLHGSLNAITNKAFSKEVIFDLISPENLVFETNTINGFAPLEKDTSIADYNFLRSYNTDVKALNKEPFSNSGAKDPTVYFHLKQNTATGKGNSYTFGVASQNIFENTHKPFNKKEQKLAAKVLKNSKVDPKADTKTKVLDLELYLKQNFSVYSDKDPRLETPESIFEIKAFNDLGAIRVYNHLLNELGVESEIVVTCNRFRHPFQSDFESFTFLDKYILYLPEIDSYLNPAGKFDRLGVIPPGFLHNNGLFIKKVSLGGISTGSGSVKFIKAPNHDHTKNDMFIEVKLDESLDSLNVTLGQQWSGYYAQTYQPYFGLLPEDVEKEITDDFVYNIVDDAKIKSIEVVNGGFEHFMVEPLTVNATFSSPSLLEKAGRKILVKVGDLIGPQSELYQEKERTLPVENSFNRTYYRKIKIEIPEGFTCNNLDDLNITVNPFNEGSNDAFFTSKYSLNGNVVEVEIDEVYNRIYYPLEEFEDYRAVINAAADFNKVVLVFDPI